MAVEAIAVALLQGDALAARSLVQDWLADAPDVAAEPPPMSLDVQIRTVAAALAELFAQRLSQSPPSWTKDIGPLEEPIYLLRAARTMHRLRRRCEEESPDPLRRRRLFAPKEYLAFA